MNPEKIKIPSWVEQLCRNIHPSLFVVPLFLHLAGRVCCSVIVAVWLPIKQKEFFGCSLGQFGCQLQPCYSSCPTCKEPLEAWGSIQAFVLGIEGAHAGLSLYIGLFRVTWRAYKGFSLYPARGSLSRLKPLQASALQSAVSNNSSNVIVGFFVQSQH